MDEVDINMQGGTGTAIAPESDGRPEDVLNAELAPGSLLFTSGAAGQRIRESLLVLNEKLHGGRLHIFLGFEALILTFGGGISGLLP